MPSKKPPKLRWIGLLEALREDKKRRPPPSKRLVVERAPPRVDFEPVLVVRPRR